MNKIFTLLLFFVCAITMYAQDIIVTKDSQRIESKITEVDDTNIKYKKWSYQDGPVFTIKISNIAAIIWANGEVESFDIETIETPGTTIQTQIQAQAQTEVQTQTEIPEPTQTKADIQSKNDEYTPIPTLSREGELYYSSNGKIYDENELKLYLKQNCAEAYNVWRKGENTRTAGWLLFSIGLGMDLGVSISYLALGGYVGSAGTAFAVVGGLCELACIPTLIVGYQKKNKAIECYNHNCSQKNKYLSLNVGASNNQIGLVLHF